MANQSLAILRYLIAKEDSRPGAYDYWNYYFLAGKTHFQRSVLGISKVGILVALSFFAAMALTRLG